VCGADGSKRPASGELLKIDAPDELFLGRLDAYLSPNAGEFR